jgi:hypothetical protein
LSARCWEGGAAARHLCLSHFATLLITLCTEFNYLERCTEDLSGGDVVNARNGE